MGFYNVVTPCVVGKLHYTRPTTAPIEVDDKVAAPLVESGCLEAYRPGAGQAAKLGLEIANRSIQYIGEKTAEAVADLDKAFPELAVQQEGSVDQVKDSGERPDLPKPPPRSRKRTED